jgi:hypothetical protein
MRRSAADARRQIHFEILSIAKTTAAKASIVLANRSPSQSAD